MFKGTLTAVLTIAVLVANVSAQDWDVGCIDTGVSANCFDFIDSFCGSIGGITVRPLDNVARCFNLDSKVKCDFTAWFDTPGNSTKSAEPSVESCKQLLGIASKLCPMGGFGHITGERGFQYLVDPNLGSCGSDEANGNPS
ncbi:hypothetical protein FA15DRAFT_693918 [Coprinopsis marcescibilis]|uniref:Glycan binding protein Y3-like domain-containing protein n=1 Tax=Coprinopsis marcescibilis TaxID=230819 RepID=A0A5C3KY00_COPMA|nr:hypothetical protein FA15DRAFT_693918 [Coprinopsis marcescibilis]